MIEEGNQLIW